MSNGKRKYVPIIKWKRAEQGALRDLREDQKVNMTPLIEIIPVSIDKKILTEEAAASFLLEYRTKDIPVEILKSWGDDPIYVDMTLISPDELKQAAMSRLLGNCRELRLVVVPVINLVDSLEYRNNLISWAKQTSDGICLRITSSELNNIQNLNLKLEAFLTNHAVKSSDVALLVDLKDKTMADAVAAGVKSVQDVVHLNTWRDVIISGGSFPQDLTGYKRDEDNREQRTEWVNWKSQALNGEPHRLPSFSDYTIRHPIYNEVTVNFPGTASIRYTVGDSWLVMKGEVKRFEQYLGHAALLRNLKGQYYGPDFSAGDRYIDEKGRYLPEFYKKKKENPEWTKGTGRAEDWIRAGINHHLSVVVDQLANLA